MVTSGTILIEHEICDPKKGTTKVVISKPWLVYYISSMQMYLLSTKQILQSELKVKGNKSSFTFHDKSGDVVLSATSNLWSNIQIVRTHILKHNISNPVSLTTRYPDSKNLHHNFGHISYEIMICVIFLTMLRMQKFIS